MQWVACGQHDPDEDDSTSLAAKEDCWGYSISCSSACNLDVRLARQAVASRRTLPQEMLNLLVPMDRRILFSRHPQATSGG